MLILALNAPNRIEFIIFKLNIRSETRWLLETSEQRKMILEKKGAINKLFPCGDRLEMGKGKSEFESFVTKLGGSCHLRKNAEKASRDIEDMEENIRLALKGMLSSEIQQLAVHLKGVLDNGMPSSYTTPRRLYLLACSLSRLTCNL